MGRRLSNQAPRNILKCDCPDLHYAFDLWADRWRRREATGNIVIVRYTGDIVVGFEHEADAVRFREALAVRLASFSLTLHPEKTRLIQFGRHAAAARARHGFGKPETFAFLDFTFVCGKSLRGRFLLLRLTRRDRMVAKLKAVKVDEALPCGVDAGHATPTGAVGAVEAGRGRGKRTS